MSMLFGRAGLAPKRKSRWRSFGFVALLAFIVGVVSVGLAPIVYVIGMISIIGIPIAIIAYILPTICLWIVIAYLAYKVVPLSSRFAVPASFGIALVVMAVVPQAYNFQVMRAVNGLQSDDIAAPIAQLQPSETIAELGSVRSSRKCFNRCIDLLLSRQVAAYVSVSLPRGVAEPTGQAKATRYRLVRGDSCDHSKVLPKNASSNIDKPGTVSHALNAGEQSGICIQATEMLLEDVGPMRALLYSNRRNLEFPESVFFIDTKIRPVRVAVFETTDGKDWRKIVQQTNVSYSLLGPMLAHTIGGGLISSTKSSWWRKDTRNVFIDLDRYLTTSMGARLRRQ